MPPPLPHQAQSRHEDNKKDSACGGQRAARDAGAKTGADKTARLEARANVGGDWCSRRSLGRRGCPGGCKGVWRRAEEGTAAPAHPPLPESLTDITKRPGSSAPQLLPPGTATPRHWPRGRANRLSDTLERGGFTLLLRSSRETRAEQRPDCEGPSVGRRASKIDLHQSAP